MIEIIKAIRAGKILIYPTDTVYGIGVDAANSKAVKKLRRLKKSKKPFSIIVSKGWIRENCVVDKKAEKYLKLLPGPYTLILRLKNKRAISKETNLGSNKIGVRIPKHPFTKVILAARRPFISTSVNISGEKFAVSTEEIPQRFKRVAIIVKGRTGKKPSTIYDLTGKTSKRIR